MTHLKPLLHEGDFRDEISDGVCKSILGGVVWCGLDAKDKLVLQGVRDLVASKQNLGILQQLAGGEQVSS